MVSVYCVFQILKEKDAIFNVLVAICGSQEKAEQECENRSKETRELFKWQIWNVQQ